MVLDAVTAWGLSRLALAVFTGLWKHTKLILKFGRDIDCIQLGTCILAGRWRLFRLENALLCSACHKTIDVGLVLFNDLPSIFCG